MTRNTFPWNAVGAPALALPAGRTEDGAPVSAQLVGRPGDDAFVLGVGALLEAELSNTPASGRSRTPRKEEHERNRDA
jgi:Asp-tRNA(Asn)/Glu-tRNA(Gln) amidotransferase A subunit family amidase